MQDERIDTAGPTLGQGVFRYRPVMDWAQLPDGWKFHNVAGLGVDDSDNLVVFDRGPNPVMIFDRTGAFLRSWGQGQFARPHAVHVAPDGAIWLTDDQAHAVYKYDAFGNRLLTLGTPGKPATYAGGAPFHRCTHTAMGPDEHIFVSDGYGNARVHKYDPAGRLVLSWGEPGTDPGQFNVPHNIACDPDGWVYVADRENHRIQVFDGDGNYQEQWNNLHKPCGMFMRYESCPQCYVAEAGPPHFAVNRDLPNIGPRVSVLDNKGRLLSRFGQVRTDIAGPDLFLGLHAIAVNSVGDIFVGDLAAQTWKRNWPERAEPADLTSLHHFARHRGKH